jgi:hypothetical protein
MTSSKKSELSKLTDEEIFVRYQELDAAYHTLLSGPWLPGYAAELKRRFNAAHGFRSNSARRQRVIEAGYRDRHLRYQAEHPVVVAARRGGLVNG